MRRPPKVVVVGAGRGSFGPGMVLEAASTPELRGARLALVDLDEATAARSARSTR